MTGYDDNKKHDNKENENKKNENKKNENKKNDVRRTSFNPFTLFLILILLIKSSEASALSRKKSNGREAS
ncbi:hypothetical protein [Thermosediminibacter oceani]|uniref:Uncharacterized protein n=1 Tax=Thermosediminibacter oceani (strain ATCC BAA-1034 / DSM 16646 / JW/IW-1228P) TaxID=555079 RepID=D9S295_THEOJ|nr:hypothetical protein [Thermosediminibacter oceani]ADL07522.1 hypothetical protein Toce_0756 [Thermosediminibacter oceani DSM 16646]